MSRPSVGLIFCRSRTFGLAFVLHVRIDQYKFCWRAPFHYHGQRCCSNNSKEHTQWPKRSGC
jgi:hypothetical protein